MDDHLRHKDNKPALALAQIARIPEDLPKGNPLPHGDAMEQSLEQKTSIIYFEEFLLVTD